MKRNGSCLIVGAGMAGLTAGSLLQSRGWSVVVLDKGRNAGGRMATRTMGESRLDHGAQFFTARNTRFARLVGVWESAGWVAPWYAHEGHIRYFAAGGMNALAGCLADPLDVRTQTKVTRIDSRDGRWQVVTENGQTFAPDTLLLTPPAPQCAELLATCADCLPPRILPALAAIEYDPCFALLVTLPGSGGVPAPGFVRPDSGPVEWIADNTQKGIACGSGALTIHATPEFSRKYLEAPKEEVARLLLEAAQPWFAGSPTDWRLHRWKYSRPVPAGRPMCLIAEEPAPLVIAGDAFGGGRVEGAWLSGLAAAEAIG
jgi:predicted NAD/FAD-dependent oxidoreductase